MGVTGEGVTGVKGSRGVWPRDGTGWCWGWCTGTVGGVTDRNGTDASVNGDVNAGEGDGIGHGNDTARGVGVDPNAWPWVTMRLTRGEGRGALGGAAYTPACPDGSSMR